MVKPLADGGDVRPWIAEAFVESEPAFSPDGRWVAYSSNQTGVKPNPTPALVTVVTGWGEVLKGEFR